MAKKPRPNVFYPTYYFGAEEQDPGVDWLRHVVQMRGLDDPHGYHVLHERSNLALSTIRNLFEKRKTRKPHHATMQAIARSMDAEWRLCDIKTGRVIPAPKRRRK